MYGHTYARKAVEDPYHVCMECPLYDRARLDLYHKLQSADFTFPTNLTDTYVALMNVNQPDAVRSVGRFLSDCMAIRDTYQGNTTNSHWINKTNKAYARTCVDTQSANSDQSFNLLKQHGCDVTVCKQVASHQPIIVKA